MDTPHYTIRQLEDTRNDHMLLKAFDKKLSDYEKLLDEKLVKDRDIVYNTPAALFDSGDAAAFVALMDGIPVAYIVGKVKKHLPLYGNTWYGYIESMFVDEGYRKHGIATALFLRIKEWFSGRNIHTLELRLFANNEKAIALYEKWGFKPHVLEMKLEDSQN